MAEYTVLNHFDHMLCKPQVDNTNMMLQWRENTITYTVCI